MFFAANRLAIWRVLGQVFRKIFAEGHPMKIVANHVVTLHYTLTDDSSKVLDSSAGAEPLVYLHGHGGIIPGLEEALSGRAVGDKFQVKIPAEKAYGPKQDQMVQKVPRGQFPDPQNLAVGMAFQVDSNQGPRIFTVTGLTDDEVTVDGNHPLAGLALNFDVSIEGIRAATAEEVSHGHAHGADGHGHH